MTPAPDIDSRRLLLIGAGPGVGAAIVRRFAREGFRATLASRGGERLDQLAADLREDGAVVDTLVADASDLDGYRSALERL